MLSFTHSLSLISRCTRMARGAALRAHGVCGGQVPYLLRLGREPGLTQEELSRALCLNKSSVARQVASLERSGLVRREPDPSDRRQQRVYLTERALSLLPEVRRVVSEWNAYLLAELGEEERQHLQEVMERLSERAQRRIEQEVGWTE